MKKFIVLIFVLMFSFSFFGCEQNSNDSNLIKFVFDKKTSYTIQGVEYYNDTSEYLLFEYTIPNDNPKLEISIYMKDEVDYYLYNYETNTLSNSIKIYYKYSNNDNFCPAVKGDIIRFQMSNRTISYNPIKVYYPKYKDIHKIVIDNYEQVINS